MEEGSILGIMMSSLVRLRLQNKTQMASFVCSFVSKQRESAIRRESPLESEGPGMEVDFNQLNKALDRLRPKEPMPVALFAAQIVNDFSRFSEPFCF